MLVALRNKTKVDDEVILGFIERADSLLGLGSRIAVKVTQVQNRLRPTMHMSEDLLDDVAEPHDCHIWLRVPPFASTWTAVPEDEVDEWCQQAAVWFERAVRHEFTHVWQMENLPEWREDYFRGYGYRRYRRQNWANRPVEIDCRMREDNIKAGAGGEGDIENVQFLVDYYANEIRTR